MFCSGVEIFGELHWENDTQLNDTLKWSDLNISWSSRSTEQPKKITADEISNQFRASMDFLKYKFHIFMMLSTQFLFIFRVRLVLFIVIMLHWLKFVLHLDGSDFRLCSTTRRQWSTLHRAPLPLYVSLRLEWMHGGPFSWRSKVAA